MKPIFEVQDILQKLRYFAQTSQVAQIDILKKIKRGRGLTAQQRPLQNFVPQAPKYGSTYMYGAL